MPNHTKLKDAVDHIIQNVLAAAADYQAAERELTLAFNTNQTASAWEAAALTAKRRAAELAIAIDGLTDRTNNELGVLKSSIRQKVSALGRWPSSAALRTGAMERMRGVANAYKHKKLTDKTLPIASESDVLVVGLGYGLEGYSVGKQGVPEVLVREKSGMSYKFLGDAPVAVHAWFRFLAANGATLPHGPYQVCGLQVHP